LSISVLGRERRELGRGLSMTRSEFRMLPSLNVSTSSILWRR
jgi:hypothetical protein